MRFLWLSVLNTVEPTKDQDKGQCCSAFPWLYKLKDQKELKSHHLSETGKQM